MVIWTRHAKKQLSHIYQYIEQDSPLYAKRVSEELVRKTIGLDEIPLKGRKVPELDDEAVRELNLHSYRILYEIKSSGTIEVLAVIHTRQHLNSGDVPRV